MFTHDAEISRALLGSTWVGLDFNRPATVELEPKSDWYRWANPGPARLPDLPYFNVYADMNIVLNPCVLIFFCDRPPQVIVPLGDVALQTGTDDPFDTPPKGGTRFLKGVSGAQNWQWQMSVPIIWDPHNDPQMLGALGSALLLPQAHPNFGDHMAEITQKDCQTGADTALDVILFRLVQGRMTDNPYNCQA